MEGNYFSAKLVNHKIFDCFKKVTIENGSHLKNLTELKDDVLFVWNQNENCLQCLNLKTLEESSEEQPYQKLHLTQPPAFAPDRILAGACGTRVCVWGSRGVLVMELPGKWGKAGLFEGGKDTVLCKSYPLDERFLYTQGEVRRVHWHPTSLSHVLVLVSDNTLRLYNIALKTGPKLVRILSVGSRPSARLAGRPLLDSLGDTAVDFTPLGDRDSALVLMGNGDLYIIELQLAAKSQSQPKLRGPLTMYPQADDNYGSESCSIAVVGSNPAVLVIATSCHVLYHCLLLPTGDNESQDKDDNDFALYVIEAVELSIQLTPDDGQLQYSYPVHLYTCPGGAGGTGAGTYACVHAGGVHAVSVPAVAKLRQYMLAGDEDTETLLSSLTSVPSSARYSVCTRARGDTPTTPAAPLGTPRAAVAAPLGFFLSPPPLSEMALLCADGKLITRTLEPFDLEERLYKELQLKNPALEKDEIKAIFKERQKLSFSAIVQEILARDVSQPILNTNSKEELSPKESLEFLTEATLKLRGEYISRQSAAADAVRHKLNALRDAATLQDNWEQDLKNEITQMLRESAQLRDKLSSAEKRQENIKYRCSVVHRALRGGSTFSTAERTALRELQSYRDMRDNYSLQLQQLKQRADEHYHMLEKWDEEYKKKDIALGKSHSDSISSILQQQTCQISTLIEETKDLKEKLSID